MSFRLNLTALTDEELQSLVGLDRAMGLMPEISHARLESRPVLGPSISEALNFEVLEDRAWGATPEQTRQLQSLRDAFEALGAEDQGIYYAPHLSEMRHTRGYVLEPDVAASVRWSDTPESPRTAKPYVQFVSWPRDNASGIACIVTTNLNYDPAPAISEEIDYFFHPEASVEELLNLHRQHALRHGKVQKVNGNAGWLKAWQAVHALNLAAWRRRGLLLPNPVAT